MIYEIILTVGLIDWYKLTNYSEHQGSFVDETTGDTSRGITDKVRSVLCRYLYLLISLNRVYTLKLIYLTRAIGRHREKGT